MVSGFEGDEALNIRPDRPPGTPALTASERDPHDCWVHMGVNVDGSIKVTRGDHAICITP
jgi:hypothetical protein